MKPKQMRSGLSYEQWIESVDALVERRLGCSLHDLPDVSLRDWYDDDLDTQREVEKIIRNAQE